MSGPLKDVIRIALEPVALETQISGEPDLSEMKAIFLPSGEYLAAVSGQVEAMNTSAAFGGSPGPGILARHMLASRVSTE